MKQNTTPNPLKEENNFLTMIASHEDSKANCDSTNAIQGDCCADESTNQVAPTYERRDFLKFLGLTTTAAATLPALSSCSLVYGASKKYYSTARKKFPKKWLNSLLARGGATTFTGKQLGYIGMPINGLCTGMLYMGGDGKLWLWDIMNQSYPRGLRGSDAFGMRYIEPLQVDKPYQSYSEFKANKSVKRPYEKFTHGFSVSVKQKGKKTVTKSLDYTGFKDISFVGQTPLAKVAYRDKALPVDVNLTAYTPYIPLDYDSSSYPCTILEYQVANTSKFTTDVSLTGLMQNISGFFSKNKHSSSSRTQFNLTNSVVDSKDALHVKFDMLKIKKPINPKKSKDIVFEDFEGDYSKWKVEGSAFGVVPFSTAEMKNSDYLDMGIGTKGKGAINSYLPTKSDKATGSLTSKSFTILRDYIVFWVGGGTGKNIGLRVLVNGKEITSARSDKKSNALRPIVLNVSQYQGKKASIQIYDEATTGWGQIGVDNIMFTDNIEKYAESKDVKNWFDYGNMTLTCLKNNDGKVIGNADNTNSKLTDKALSYKYDKDLIANITNSFTLKPGEKKTATFILSWYYPNLSMYGIKGSNHYYAHRFKSSTDVSLNVIKKFPSLRANTFAWHKTWYEDSTLPHWLLERTLIPSNTLQTNNCFMIGVKSFKTGKVEPHFAAWEGVNCCPGTCVHVWHYAQAHARLFPQIDRTLLDDEIFSSTIVSRGKQKGAIAHRLNPHRLWTSKNPASGFQWGTLVAVDGHMGVIMRVYRMHLMQNKNSSFLKDNWNATKDMLEWLIKHHDKNEIGLLSGNQHNTLDASWSGYIAQLCSLYLAALRTCEEMATLVGDNAYAKRVATIRAKGKKAMDNKLFNGEYYIQDNLSNRKKGLGVYDGCHIDMVMGDSWTQQLGLGDVMTDKNVRTSLKSLWKYNFVMNMGKYREKYPTKIQGRTYALEGDKGLVMASWPKTYNPVDLRINSMFLGGYFQECMTGFEYFAATHMAHKGMLKQALIIARAIHDRYSGSPEKRNAYNEIECSSHYARAMSSYGLYLAICGFHCDDTKGLFQFAPKMNEKNFSSAYTNGSSWGTIQQTIEDSTQKNAIIVRYGNLSLKTISLMPSKKLTSLEVKGITLNGKDIAKYSAKKINNGFINITFNKTLAISKDGKIEVVIA